PGDAAAGQRDGHDLPAVVVGGLGEADVDDPGALEPLADELAGQQTLALAQRELAHVDRAAPQAGAVGADLTDPADADEHAPALHGDDEAVDPRRLGAEVDDRVGEAAHLGAVRPQERQPGQSGEIDDAPFHGVIGPRVSRRVPSLQRDVHAALAFRPGPEDASVGLLDGQVVDARLAPA